MGEARNVVERFYQRFGAGDMTEAFACFAAECIALTPSGALNNEKHEAIARLLKHAIPDGHMELIRTLESDGEIYVTGRFKGTHRNDLSTPLGTIVASNHPLDLFFTDYFRVASGKIVECEAVWDRLSIVAQLGASIGADVGHLPALLSRSMTGAGEPPGPDSGP
jgi:ketosteroid isomerase-like protein